MHLKNKKLTILIGVVVVLATTGAVLGLNGFFGGGGSIPSDTMTRGLVGYWNFDEGLGQTAYDISGNGNNGQLGSTTAADAGDPLWAKGKVGSALNFDGVDDYVQIIVSQATTTVSLWVRNSGVWEYVVNVSGTTYVNGKTGVPTSYPIYFSGTTMQIGKTGAIAYFTGLIDEVRIYNRALSAAEVRYHYNRGGPVLQLKFDEGSGSTTYDSSGSGNNGVLTNMAATTSWTSGKYGGALQFDGTGGYVEVPNSSSTNITESVTVEFWVKPE